MKYPMSNPSVSSTPLIENMKNVCHGGYAILSSFVFALNHYPVVDKAVSGACHKYVVHNNGKSDMKWRITESITECIDIVPLYAMQFVILYREIGGGGG